MSKTTIATGGIADSAVATAKIADDAVGNTKLDLSANYAFTGTITGAGGGLVKISSTSTSDASSITLTSQFSSTYRNYLVILDDVGSTTSDTLEMVLINSSGAITSNTYVQTYVGWQSGVTSGQHSRDCWRLHQTNGFLGNSAPHHYPRLAINIFSPQLTTGTGFTCLSHFRNDSNSAWIMEMNSGHQVDGSSSVGTANQCTGFRIETTNGNQFNDSHGKITVYGYEA